MKPQGPVVVQFCPRSCLSLVLRGEGTDRCKKGYWRESSPDKAPLFYAQFKVEGGVRKFIEVLVVRPSECKEGE